MSSSDNSNSSNSHIDKKVLKTVVVLAYPVTLSYFLQTLVGFADIYMVGHLGAEAIAAVGISRQIVMMISVLVVAITSGSMALVANYTGANSPSEVSKVARQSLILVVFFSLGLTIIAELLASKICAFLSPSPEVTAMGTSFLRIQFFGIVLMFANFTVSSCLQGAGDTKTPLYIGVLVNIVNIICDYLFIFGVGFLPKMGVSGAALSAVVARFVGASLGIWALYSGRFRVSMLKETSYKPDWDLIKRILSIGVPSAIQGVFRNSSTVAFTKIISMTASATSGVAALSIGSQIERITRTMSLAFAVVATTLVGQSLGAGKAEEAEKRGWTTSGLIVAITGFLALSFIFFPREIIRIFIGSKEVTELGVSYLYASAVTEPFAALSIVMAGGLRGAGETKAPLYYTILAQWLIRLPLAYILAFPLGLGAKGAWWSLAISSVIQGLLTANKFRRGEWKKRGVI